MYLIFDIGGTKMRLAVSANGESFDEPKIIPTPQSFEEGMSVFKKTFDELVNNKKIKTCVGGIRRLDSSKSMLVPDFRLPDWSHKPLKKRLTDIVRGDVYLENDTALVGLGEAIMGAGIGYSIVCYLTISTGVGGVRIVDGKIDANKLGFEPGHQTIDFDWTKFPDLKNLEDEGFGQLEAYVSGASLTRRFGKLPKEIEDTLVWEEIETIIAHALKNTVVYWSPDTIILGGGMLGSPGISVEKVKSKLSRILKIFPEIPEIKKAELGDVGGLHGALCYLKQIEVAS